MIVDVAMLNTGYRCLVGVAMGMPRAYCSHPSSQRLCAKSALCAADKQRDMALGFLVWLGRQWMLAYPIPIRRIGCLC